MKFIFYAILLLSFSCTEGEVNDSANSLHKVDTIYSGSSIELLSENSFIIIITDTSLSDSVEFKVGRTDFIKIRIPRFKEYPISIRNIKNATLLLSDTVNGIFGIIPSDTSFYVEFWQNYGKGKVVRKHAKTDSTFDIFPMNESHHIGSKTFQALTK